MVSRIRHIAPRIAPWKTPKSADVILFFLLALVVIGVHPLQPIGRIVTSGEGDTDRQVAYLLLFLGSLFVFGGAQDIRRLAPFPTAFAMLLGWCWISVAWSVAPAITLRRLALISMLAWMAFMAVERMGFQRSLRMLQLVLLAALLLNYAAVFATPIGVHRVGDPLDPGLIGNWRGFLPHKNHAGAVCAITIIAFLFVRDPLTARWRFLIMALTGYFLYRTMSKSSMGFLAVAMACGWIYMLLRARQRPFLIPFAALAAILVVYVGGSYVNLGGYHSPDMLTGRIQIWPVLLEYAKDHPWLGAGFGAFWSVGTASPVYQYSRSWVADIASGHNGYLDILTQIGLPGLVLAVVALVAVPGWQLLANTRIAAGQGALLTAALVFCAGHNLTESDLLSRDGFVGIMQILVIALIAQAARAAAPRQAAPARHHGLSGVGFRLPVMRMDRPGERL